MTDTQGITLFLAGFVIATIYFACVQMHITRQAERIIEAIREAGKR